MTDQKKHRDLLAKAEKHLSDSTNTATRDRISLRDAVCAYLTAELARGVTAATVLATVSEILLRAEKRAGNSSDGHQEFAQQMIDWCLSANPLLGPRLGLQN